MHRFGLLVLLVCASMAARPSSSADLQITSTGADLVGERFTVGAQILAAGGEGPGDVSLTIIWGAERSSPYQLGAVTLEALPTLLDPSLSATLGSDCDASVGSATGSCSLTFGFEEPTAAGVQALASFDFIYEWLLAPGFEHCTDSADPSCLDAGQQVLLRVDSSVFGGPNYAASIFVGTFGLPRVRPIPEPTTATLTAIGLVLLGGTGRRTGRAEASKRVSE